MAATFGLWELKFPSSRAVDEDDEEADEITPVKEQEVSPQLLWSPKIAEKLEKSGENKVECSTLVLGVDIVATTFLNAHLLCGGNSEVVGVLSGDHRKKDFNVIVESQKEKNSLLHRLANNQDVLVCQCQAHVDQGKAFLWTKKLFDNIKTSKVIILTSAPGCEYSTPNPSELTPDFIKMLHTKSWTKECGKMDIGFVETPNTVRGVPAAILGHCQVYNIPAAIYVCYTASLHVDVQSVEAFGILLKTKEFSILKKSPNAETTKVLKSLGIGRTSHEYLYL